MKGKYIVIQNTYSDEKNCRTGYGIAFVEVYDGIITILRSVSDISSDRNEIEDLVKQYNRLGLDPIHLQDVLADSIGITQYIP